MSKGKLGKEERLRLEEEERIRKQGEAAATEGHTDVKPPLDEGDGDPTDTPTHNFPAGGLRPPEGTEYTPDQPSPKAFLNRIGNNVGQPILFISAHLMSGFITSCSLDEDVFNAVLFVEGTVRVKVEGGTVALPPGMMEGQTLLLQPALRMYGIRHFDKSRVNLEFTLEDGTVTQDENPMQFIFVDEGLDYATTILAVQNRNKWRARLRRQGVGNVTES